MKKVEEIPVIEKASNFGSINAPVTAQQNQILNQSGLMLDIEKLRLAGQAGLADSFIINALINNQNKSKPGEEFKIKKPIGEKKNNKDKPKNKTLAEKNPEDNKKVKFKGLRKIKKYI